jgi:hypothetical protein
MSLGQFEDFYADDSYFFDDTSFVDFGDFSTDIYDWGAVDYDIGWDFDTLYDPYAGSDDWFTYDFDTVDTLGYDVYDPFAAESSWYDPDLTMMDDYNDAFAFDDWSAPDFDAATGIGWDDDAYLDDWAEWEDAGELDVAAQFPDADTAIASFSLDFPEIDWGAVATTGLSIYKLYTSLQQPTAPSGTTYPKTSVMQDPRTGKLIPAVMDPRTGQLVPATRDPKTGVLVPTSSIQKAGVIPGVPDWALMAGIGVAGFMMLSQGGGAAPRRRRRKTRRR